MSHGLYRGKRRNGEWVYGYLVKFGPTGKETWSIIPSCASALYTYEVDPETVGQYTGRTDQCGNNKLFSGDKVLVYYGQISEEDGPAIIEWDDDEACFMLVWDGLTVRLGEIPSYAMRHIGTIYDNSQEG